MRASRTFAAAAGVLLAFVVGPGFLHGAYDEPLRPQFHFTPRQGWIGDPDGLVTSGGLHHLYWWGHAISEDLVHWKELPYPMKGGSSTFDYFSGSVVVDTHNTSGLGTAEQPPWLAIYTAHDRSSGFDDQRMSHGFGGRYFDYYKNNPILSIEGMPCRDPDVFWHEASGRWIMSLVAPQKHKVLFHASENLTSWDYAGEFGLQGAVSGDWEAPLLVRLRSHDEAGALQWVLFTSVGPNKIQYFPGNFDGSRFAVDEKTRAFLEAGVGLPGETLFDFEGAEPLKGWQNDGKAFAHSVSGPAGQTTGFLGRKFVKSRTGGRIAGKLVSPEFLVTRPNLNFLLGGGSGGEGTTIRLLVDGKVVRSARGDNSKTLVWRGWDVSPFAQRSATLEIVDSGDGGFIAVDHIMLSDVLLDTGRPQANWVDWGFDFYAARAWRKPGADDVAEHWIAWMGNWDYAREVPTTWGKGALSIPREIFLRPSPRGPQVIQHPLPGLEKLREEVHEVEAMEILGRLAVPGFHPRKNCYEMELSFDRESSAQSFGLRVGVNGGNYVTVGYDVSAQNVFIDRTASGDTSFSSKFPGRSAAPVLDMGKELTLRVFVDQSSVEVFVNKGEAVLTSLVFPNANDVGVELFATGGVARLRSLRAWMLHSIWATDPVQMSGDASLRLPMEEGVARQ